MPHRMALLGRGLPGLTIAIVALSAATLFMIELVVGKQLTMQVGGSGAAWLLLLACFQATLLLGYAYAWWQRCQPRPLLHLLLISLCLLVFVLSWLTHDPSMAAEAVAQPLRWTLGQYLRGPAWAILLCATTVTTMQTIIPESRRASLYAASNAGALIAVLAYPLCLEPLLGIGQSMLLLMGLVGLILAAHAIALVSNRGQDKAALGAQPATEKIACRTILALVFWAGLGSAFLTLTTAWAGRDLAAHPLLWSWLLAAYLASWVTAMSPYGRRLEAYADSLAASALLLVFIMPEQGWWHALAMAATVYLICSAVHLRVARSYPEAAHAPANVALALGGSLGSLALALLPPIFFTGFYELPLILAILALGSVLWVWSQGEQPLARLLKSMPLLLACLFGILHESILAPGPWTVLHRDRDFHGTWTVSLGADSSRDFRLVSGGTYHGSWGEDASWAYYAEDGPVGAIFTALRESERPLHLLLVGLGAGTCLRYLKTGDSALAVDISPALMRMHQGSPPLIPTIPESPAELILRLADGRQVLATEPEESLDLIILDAFTSGAIPPHLLTIEALELAWSRRRPGGLLAIHCTNRHLAVADLVMNAARAAALPALLLEDDGGDQGTANTWVLLGERQTLSHPSLRPFSKAQYGLQDLGIAEHQHPARAWTDTRSSVLPYLLW